MYPIIHLTPAVGISTYFFLISIGTVLGVRWFLNRTPEKLESAAIRLSFFVLVVGFVGARLLHVFFEQPRYYGHHPLAILFFWRGGFVYYGGLLAGLAAGLIEIALYDPRSFRKQSLVWLDRASLPVGLAYAVGRLGCFLNGCCYGRFCEWAWAVRFRSHADWGMEIEPRHPTQLYAAGGDILLLLFLHRIERHLKRPGLLFFIWLGGHGLNRMLTESFRDDDRGQPIFGWSVSTVTSLCLVLISVVGIARVHFRSTDAENRTAP